MVTLTWHACKCKVHKRRERYILKRLFFPFGKSVGWRSKGAKNHIFLWLHISEAAPAPAPEGTSAEKPPGAEGTTEKTNVTEKTSASQMKRDESRDSSLSKPSSVQRSRDRNKDPNEPQVRGSLRTIHSVRFRYHRWESQWELEVSVLSGSDAAGERVSENWKCQFCPVQMLQVRESVRTGSVSSVWFRYCRWKSQWFTHHRRDSPWELEFHPVQIPQVRKSVNTENVCAVHFGYRRWESVGTRTIHSVLFSSDTTSEKVSEHWKCLFSPFRIPQMRVSGN